MLSNVNESEEVIPVTINDAKMIIDLIENPPPPNQKLKDAFEKYTEMKKENAI